MKVILEMNEQEALQAIEAGLLAPLLSRLSRKTMDAAADDCASAPVVEKAELPTTEQKVPVAAAVSVAPTVPVTEHAYTLDEISRAAATFMDRGDVSALRALLQQFGVQSLVELPKEQYGSFVLAMRQQGVEV